MTCVELQVYACGDFWEFSLPLAEQSWLDQTNNRPKSLMSIVAVILTHGHPEFHLRAGSRPKSNLDNSGFGRTMVRMKKVRSGNRMEAPGASSEAVDAYIAAVPEPARTPLVRLREIIRSAVPKEAVEVISYGIPAFKLSKPFFGFAAFKNHLSVLPFSGSLFNTLHRRIETV